MSQIGVKIDSLPEKLKYVRDVEYFEGPLMEEYQDEKGDFWWQSWVDHKENYDGSRWILFKINEEDRLEYFNLEKTWLDLFKNASSLYLLDDLLEDGNRVGNYDVYFVKFEELPNDYIPSNQSYFDPSLMPK